MIVIAEQQIREILNHRSLIDALATGFRERYEQPDRHHHFYRPAGSSENTLLLMPAWNDTYIGVKQVVSAPGNGAKGIPTIHGLYSLMDARTGQLMAVMDAGRLTAIRTACASALAARYLAPARPTTLLVIGGGKVASELIPAHLAVRDYQKVLVWTRRREAFDTFKRGLLPLSVPVIWERHLEEAVRKADVISCATLSEVPLVKGAWLRAGQHLDLIGSFKMGMREADNLAVSKSSIFVDSRYGALNESGELGIPAREGVIGQRDILADIKELCREEHDGRTTPEEITLFKSVGLAIEDLVAASLVYKSVSSR